MTSPAHEGDMPEREAFEAWYDAQPNGRIEPWDVWQAALSHSRALAADQPGEAVIADLHRSNATIYALNAKGYNRWSALVQPGQDDDGNRISNQECNEIARSLFALAAPSRAKPIGCTTQAGGRAMTEVHSAWRGALKACGVGEADRDAISEVVLGMLTERGIAPPVEGESNG